MAATIITLLLLVVLVIASSVFGQKIIKKDGLFHQDGLYTNLACQGSEVTFTCRTIGSQAIAWRSKEFIGRGTNTLGMVHPIHEVGYSRRGAGGLAVVTLTRAEEDEDGSLILESTCTLRINTTNVSNPVVTCTDGTDNKFDNHSFTVVASLHAPQELVIKQWQCRETCYASSTWQRAENSEAAFVTGHSVSINGGDFKDLQTNASNGNRLSGSFQLPSCDNHSISVAATSVCGRGPTTTVALNKMSKAPPNVCEPSSPGGGMTSNKCSLETAIGLILVVLAVTP